MAGIRGAEGTVDTGGLVVEGEDGDMLYIFVER